MKITVAELQSLITMDRSDFKAGQAEVGVALAALNEKLDAAAAKSKATGAALNSTGGQSKSAAQSFGSLSLEVGGFAIAATAAVGVAEQLTRQVASLAAESIASAARIEEVAASVRTLRPDIDQSYVQGRLEQISVRTGQSVESLGRGLYNLFSSVDVSAAQGTALLEKFSKGAIAAQTDTSTFGTAVLGVMNAYNLSVTDADHISDVFFNTVNRGVLSGQDLAANLGLVTPTAKGAGLSMEELGAAIVAVTKEGGPAAQNINNLNNLLVKLHSSAAEAGFKELGIQTTTATGQFRPFGDVIADLAAKLDRMTEAGRQAALQKLFPDIQAQTALKVITDQTKAYNASLDDNINKSGQAAAAQNIMSDTAAQRLRVVNQEIEGSKRSIGEGMLPATEKLVGAFTALTPAVTAIGLILVDKLNKPLQQAVDVLKFFGIAAPESTKATGAGFADMTSQIVNSVSRSVTEVTKLQSAISNLAITATPEGADRFRQDEQLLHRALGTRDPQSIIDARNAETQASWDAQAAAKARYDASAQGQLESAIKQSQTQVALDKLRATNRQYIQSQVEVAKEQRAAEDALDIQLKAAGLIDQTRAEQRAKAHTTTAVDFVRSQITAVHDSISAGIDAMSKLTTLRAPSNLQAKIKEFAGDADMLIQGMQDIARKYSKDQIDKLDQFGQAASTVIGDANSAADLFQKLPDIADNIRSYLPPFFANLGLFIKDFASGAKTWASQLSVETVTVADEIKSEVEGVIGAVDFFKGLADQRVDVRGQINLFFTELSHTIRLFAAYSDRWKLQASDDIAHVATNVGAVMDGVNKALDPMTKFAAAGEVGQYQIDDAFQNVEYALGKFAHLSELPALQGDRLRALQNTSAALGSAFGGLKSAVDVVTAVGQAQAATDSGDTAYGIDQLVGAVAGMTGAKGGDTYILQVNGLQLGSDPDIGALIKKILGHQALIGGGAVVGAGA